MGSSRDKWAEVMASHSGIKLQMGPTAVDRFLGDAKRVAFFHERYKFAARMLNRCQSIIDVGCGDGSGLVTFLSDTSAQHILGVDFDPAVIEYAKQHLMSALRQVRPQDCDRLGFECRDFLGGKFYAAGVCDGIVCLDVIEHVEPGAEVEEFIRRIARTLTDTGVAVIGTPNVVMTQYASKQSQIGHINLYDADRLRAEMEMEFGHVWVMPMNDALVHFGMPQLSNYLLALCVK